MQRAENEMRFAKILVRLVQATSGAKETLSLSAFGMQENERKRNPIRNFCLAFRGSSLEEESERRSV